MKNNEWFTPHMYIQAAREVMGGIDLDPASCEQANRTVKATRYYTKEENGLMMPWYGRIWMNPPFGKTDMGGMTSLQREFTAKLLRDFASGAVEQAIILCIANPSVYWFQPFLDFSVCFLRGHLYFTRPDGSQADINHAKCFVYLGPNEQKFIEVFSQFGRIVRAIDTPKAQPINLDLWTAESEVVA